MPGIGRSGRLLPREKALKFGVSSLEDEELLALILSVGNSKRDVFKLARGILERFTLRELSNLPLKAFMGIDGVGPAKAVRLAAAFEIGRRLYSVSEDVLNNEHLREHLRRLSLSRRETLILLMYDASGRFLGKEVIAIGSMNVAYVHPREVFDPLFKSSAHRFIVAHNHPSGNPDPSPEDRELSRKLSSLAEDLGFDLMESFVVSGKRAFGILTGAVLEI